MAVLADVQRAVCYLRRSREDEEAERRGEDTLAKQRELMVDDVLSRFSFAWDLAPEVASGDSIADRPVFRSLLPHLGTTYQAIVCKDLSRLGRGSYADMGVVYDIIKDRRIYIITADAVYDPSRFSDLRMIRFSLFFNREEYEMTLWRLTEGKKAGARKGRWVAGAVPYGFRYDRDRQVLVPHADEADVVRLIFRLHTEEGLGYRAITQRLRSIGLPSPTGKNTWHPEVIRRMLRNPAYQGTLAFLRTQRARHDGRIRQRPMDEQIVVPGAFDAIVKPDIWQAAQHPPGQTARPSAAPHAGASHALTGVVWCRQCRGRLARQSSVAQYTKRDGTVSRYQKSFLLCKRCGYSVKYLDCEAQLASVLAYLPWDGERFADAAAAAVRVRPAATAFTSGRWVGQLDQRRQRLTRRLRRAQDLLLDGVLTEPEYEDIRTRCQRDLDELQLGLSSDTPICEPDLVAQKQRIADRIRGIQSWQDVYGRLAHERDRQRLLHALFQSVELELTHRGRGKGDPTRFDLHVQLRPPLRLNTDG